MKKALIIFSVVIGSLLFITQSALSKDSDITGIEGLLDARVRAYEVSARATLSNIASACEMYMAANGNYPSSIDDLLKGNPAFLVNKPYGTNVNGYKFTGVFRADGCTITATPVECGKTGTKILIKESMKEIVEKDCQ
jgi:hypothetical protein